MNPQHLRNDPMFLNTLYIQGYSTHQDVLAITDFSMWSETYFGLGSRCAVNKILFWLPDVHTQLCKYGQLILPIACGMEFLSLHLLLHTARVVKKKLPEAKTQSQKYVLNKNNESQCIYAVVTCDCSHLKKSAVQNQITVHQFNHVYGNISKCGRMACQQHRCQQCAGIMLDGGRASS